MTDTRPSSDRLSHCLVQWLDGSTSSATVTPGERRVAISEDGRWFVLMGKREEGRLYREVGT